MFGARARAEVVVLRDSQAVAEAVREALAGASAEERPGLERAAALIAERAGRPDAEVRGEWARAVVTAAGFDPRTQELQAIRALRKAEPGLGLATAVQLVREAAASG
ncbi:hypothetical protein I5Q34_05345 [Streptomyces sp. AV19]|uniref:hypothetical protein n=1 Tax=Streptomyces sp. AV19 TaxID=2793068 RepID=UPI0018FEC6F9|nr:hypothetical protein [Streptomyces sp. AV19]MBH1933724.1 hypothetical protein [Streptomyces sp. AV19]MDG4535771.1 hypothetical protein [Streptomyces sp. AV19]